MSDLAGLQATEACVQDVPLFPVPHPLVAAVVHHADVRAAIAELRAEIAPRCSLTGPGLDERWAVVAACLALNDARALIEASEELQWFATEHLFAHRRWDGVLEPSEGAA